MIGQCEVQQLKRDEDNALEFTKISGNQLELGAETFNVIERVQMQQSRTPPINVIDIRAHEYTPDGKGIIVSLATKYSPERRDYSVPVECLYNLISDLRTLKPPSNGAAPEPADEPSQQAPALSQASSQRTPPPVTKDLTRLNVTVPKKWMLRSGLPDHPLIVLVFDPQTEKQSGYGLTAGAAREMAVGLVKYADTVAKHQASNQKPN